jgi:FHS family L-fucose permease-like MFS transporter
VTGTATAGAVAATAAQKVADAKLVELPYLAIAVVLVAIALIIWKIRLPDISSETRREAKALRQTRSLWKHRNLVLGVPAIFIYLIAEIGVGSLLVNYISLPSIGNMSHAEATSSYLFLFWGGAMVGRFAGAGLMQKYRPEILLALVSIAAFALVITSVLTTGHLAMWTIILVGLCNSIMFPTIFTLGIKGLGPLTEEASGLLIMAIAGGALSDLQGVIADHYSLQISFLLPAACYLYVLFYALWGSKPTHAETELSVTG